MKILNEMTGQEMFFLLAGPCVIEGEEMALKIAEHVSELTDKWGIPYVFKGSFKKANRSRLDSFTGIGDEKALKILAKIRKDFQIPVVTDIHSPAPEPSLPAHSPKGFHLSRPYDPPYCLLLQKNLRTFPHRLYRPLTASNQYMHIPNTDFFFS